MSMNAHKSNQRLGYNGMTVPVRTTVVLYCVGVMVEHRLYQGKVDVGIMYVIFSIALN